MRISTMPFFKKKRNSDISQQQIIQTNGVVQPQKVLQTIPPLHNFTPPPDVVADALAKCNRRSASSVSQLIVWAREYFCAFLESEGILKLFELWEEISTVLENVPPEDCDKLCVEFEKRIFELSSQIENSTVKLDMEMLNDCGNTKDCLALLMQAQNKLYETLQDICLPRYHESKFHVKCQVDLFTNGNNASLYDILLNQNAMFYFMEFVEQEGKREVLEFWLVATNFAEQFGNTLINNSTIDFKTEESDAMVLYEKYISLQATHPLGLRNEIRSEVERLICSQDEISHCFSSAIIEAFAFLHVTCLEGFLKSSLFLSFLTDLIGSLNSSKSQQALDTSSIGSSSSVKSYPLSGSSSLTSPTHRQRGTLSFGRVNALGKFEADTDLQLFKTESNIARTVKKFVNFDEKEKAKEELAWQVAAMIVNEVTSVTMGPVDSKMILQ